MKRRVNEDSVELAPTTLRLLRPAWPLVAAAVAVLLLMDSAPDAPAQIFDDNATEEHRARDQEQEDQPHAVGHAAAEVGGVIVLKQGSDLLLREDTQGGDGLRMDLGASTIVENGAVKVRFTAPKDLLPASDSGCEIRDPGKVVVCPLPNRIRVEAARLSDRVIMDGFGSDQIAIPTVIDGGTGDDELAGGAASDTVIGGAQEDVLEGGPGDDTLSGGGDDDALDGGGDQDVLDGGPNADVLDGGGGVDTATYATRPTRVVVTIGDGSNDGNESDVSEGGSPSVRDRVLDAVERIEGTERRDDLTGDSPHLGDAGGDFLVGKGGNDDLDGAGGADVVTGEEGDDTIRGGAGADALLGGGGGDLMAGDEGDDTLDGGDGPDGMQGGEGTDVVDYSGTQLAVSVTIGNGLADDGSNVDEREGARDAVASDIERVAGTDLNPIERLTGQPLPADSIVGNIGGEAIVGLAGNDTLEGAAGADSFDAGDGDDRVLAREGVADQAISCGAGADEAVVDTNDPVAVDCEQVDRREATPAEVARGQAAGVAARVAILSRRARVSREGVTSIRIRCIGAAARCRGQLRLLAPKRLRNKRAGITLRLRKGQVLARARLSFWVRRTAKIELRLSRAARRMLAARRRLTVRAVLRATDESLPAAQTKPATAVRAVTLKPARTRRTRR